MMRNVVVPLAADDEGLAHAELAIAAQLTRTLGGRLTLIHKLAREDLAGERAMTAAAAELTISRVERQLVEQAGIQWRVEGADDVLETACRVARAERGIVVMPSRPEIDIAIALVDHGLPVLAVSAAAQPLDPLGEALVLWDGSATAVHALACALPLLREAKRVTLLEIDDGSLGRSASDALPLLADHGIRAHVLRDLAFGEKAGFALLDRIKTLAPAYVVMGGFGHARWLEGLIGGVTRRLLSDCPVPILLKH